MRGTTFLKALAVAAIVGGSGATLMADETDAGRLVAGNTAFAVDLYGKLREGDGNRFLSPFSVSNALAMTYAGARGQTADEMAKALHFTLPPDRLHPAFSELNRRLDGEPGKPRPFELSVANALWAQTGYPFLPEYLALIDKCYQSGFRPVDFKSDHEATRRTINAWVEERTRDKIRDLLPEGKITPLTRLVLTNAIYFKGTWAKPFPKSATKDEDFAVTPGRTVKTPLMRQSGRFAYAEDDAVQVLELPYAGDQLAMVVVLPRKADGLAGVESALSEAKLKGWTDALRPRQVNVGLPRFKVESSAELKGALSALGMPRAFSEQSDFSGIDGRRDLQLDAVVHKAFVDVNEEGTEAAAATAAVVGLRAEARPEPPVTFLADHPFLFLIRDKASGGVLFLGRLADPKG